MRACRLAMATTLAVLLGGCGGGGASPDPGMPVVDPSPLPPPATPGPPVDPPSSPLPIDPDPLVTPLPPVEPDPPVTPPPPIDPDPPVMPPPSEVRQPGSGEVLEPPPPADPSSAAAWETSEYQFGGYFYTNDNGDPGPAGR